MDMGLRDARVLVTAGAGGIGLETARAFVREGARVHVCDVDRDALASLARTDPAITGTVADVADRDDVSRLFDDATGRLGGLDVMVNNAGIAGPTGRVEEIRPEDWDRCLQVCLTGQFNCARLAVPHLRLSDNASIVNLSSQAGRHGFALRSPYAAAKWGVIGLTKSLAIELGPDGIRVNAVLPGRTVTRLWRRRAAEIADREGTTPDAVLARFAEDIPLGRFGSAEEVADVAAFLASPRSAYVVGQSVAADGGIARGLL